jgi:hypothetical protein
MRHVVLALTADEVDHRHVVVPAEPVDRSHERLADRVHQRRRGEPVPPVAAQEPRHPGRVLQPRLAHVEVHPVDALHLERDVIVGGSQAAAWLPCRQRRRDWGDSSSAASWSAAVPYACRGGKTGS